ncbi:MAG: tetratricopeptide repeat protein [Microscillaceae bacterium]|nr:tetratricopeptide repeat protein [Microscillaceae bacterium]
MKKLFLYKYLIISTLSINCAFAQAPHEQWLQDLSQKLSPYFETGASLPRISVLPNLSQPAVNRRRINETVIEFDAGLFQNLRDNLGSRDTLAVVYMLAHELAHYFLEKNTLEPPQNRAGAIQAELNADALGCWVSSLAQYPFDEQVLRRLFDFLQEKYFTNDLNYPQPQVRLQKIREQAQLINQYKLLEVQQVAGFLYGLDKLDLATDCLKYIEHKKFSNALIINNLGVAYLREILANPTFQTEVFRYPVAFAASGYTRRAFEAQALQKQMQAAENRFRRALELNPDFAAPRINLAILFILQNRYSTAIEELEKAAETNTAYASSAHLIKAIAYAYLGQNDQADAFFRLAVERGSMVANYNYLIFKDLRSSNQAIKSRWESMDKPTRRALVKRIEGQLKSSTNYPNPQNLNEYAYFQRLSQFNPENVPLEQLTISEKVFGNNPPIPNLQLNFVPQAQFLFWQMSYLENHPNDIFEFNVFTIAQNQGFRTSLGIGVGDSSQKLLEKYGYPDTLNDDFYLYRNAKIMFELRNNRVSAWSVFEMSE